VCAGRICLSLFALLLLLPLSGTRLLQARLHGDSDWSGGVENIALCFSERARALLGVEGGAPVPADAIRYDVEPRAKYL
jgi:hypothetical protein